MQHFFLNADFRALLDLVDRQVGLGLTPSLDALKQGSAFIHRAGLAGREYVIKVQMRIAERWVDKFAAQIDHLNGRQITTLSLILLRESGAECGEHAIRDEMSCNGRVLAAVLPGSPVAICALVNSVVVIVAPSTGVLPNGYVNRLPA